MYTKQRVSLIEYGIFKYPEGLEGWRCYRVEIGGHAESCKKECTIWLPPRCTADQMEELINGSQICDHCNLECFDTCSRARGEKESIVNPL